MALGDGVEVVNVGKAVTLASKQIRPFLLRRRSCTGVRAFPHRGAKRSGATDARKTRHTCQSPGRWFQGLVHVPPGCRLGAQMGTLVHTLHVVAISAAFRSGGSSRSFFLRAESISATKLLYDLSLKSANRSPACHSRPRPATSAVTLPRALSKFRLRWRITATGCGALKRLTWATIISAASIVIQWAVTRLCSAWRSSESCAGSWSRNGSRSPSGRPEFGVRSLDGARA